MNAAERAIADKEEREAALLWLDRSFAQKQARPHSNPYHGELFSIKDDHAVGCCQDGGNIQSFDVWIHDQGPDNSMRDWLQESFDIDIFTVDAPRWVA
jgi:hypothetical protein